MAADQLVVLSTCSDRADAERIADALVGDRHAACVNIVPGVTSVYEWQGEVHRDGELLLVIKTTRPALQGLQEAMRRLHPYEVPEIVAIPIEGGLEDYLRWVSAQTRKEG